MINKFLIVVEGCADAIFLNDLISDMVDTEIPRFDKNEKFNKGDSIKICVEPWIEIFIAGGCTHIKKYGQHIQEYSDIGYKILCILDADDEIRDKNNGGVEKRLNYLEQFQKKLDLTFSSFLFPNNMDDGDLETILLNITLKEKYQPYFKAYNRYSESVRAFSKDIHANELMESKAIVYNYCQVYQGGEMSKEKNRCYRNEFWDLSNKSLVPLKNFLKKHIK